MKKPKIAISVGDVNGVGLEIALKSHEAVSQICEPIYCANSQLVLQAANLLKLQVPSNFTISHVDGAFTIQAGVVDPQAGNFSYNSFMSAIKLTQEKKTEAVVTLPINKESWKRAGLPYVGHTDLLREHFKADAIMMLGCEEMYVALYTEHIPLREVASHIQTEKVAKFLVDLYKNIGKQKVAVLGLNPHAGDNGVLGDEEKHIQQAIDIVNAYIGEELYFGPLVPDIAFTPSVRKNYNYFVAMYHDQGLAPLKALYFEESINVSLNLPIIRTSVDHGTAFDIAYKGIAQNISYINAIKSALSLLKKTDLDKN